MAQETKKQGKYSVLTETLQREIPLNLARINFIVLLISSLLKVQTVNYQRLAYGMDNSVQISSNLRRIQRFFATFCLDMNLWSKLLMKLLPIKGPYRLSLDRTNWKMGKTNINILVLGVIYKGVSLPILWTFLGNKKGNSNHLERISLVERFIYLFGFEQIKHITADREFVGRQWWAFLIEHKIPFFIRMRENMHVVLIKKEKKVKASWLFNGLAIGQPYFYPKLVKIDGLLVYLSGMRFINQQGKVEFLIVASYHQTSEALLYYKERWQIETMFKAFKTSGFHLEDTHLTNPERLNKLMMMVAVAFIWAYKIGLYLNEEVKKIHKKKHGRKAQSIFLYGLRWLAQAFINCIQKNMTVSQTKFLSCT